MPGAAREAMQWNCSHQSRTRCTFTLILLASLSADAAMAAVGSTLGESRVTPGGEAAYSIPLRLPPGTNGMTPGLSLEYRHRQGGGLLGVGWSIAGLSGIERCARTVVQDGIAGPVTQFSVDRFCLDGQRLVVVNGYPYGASGAEYRTEIETFARIRSWGSAGTGPAYFVLEASDGRVLEYGATADSRIDVMGVQANGTMTARAWALNQIRDRSGNVIRFEYIEDSTNGSYRIATIRYNHNPGAGLAASHAVSFVYENRPVNEIDASYVAGTPVRQIARLDRIDVLYNGDVVRRYELSYEPSLSSTGRSRLASVQECGNGGADCLAPTVFRWQDGNPVLGIESSIGTGTAVLDAVATDIDGDGRDDLVWTAGSSTSQTLHYRLSLAGDSFGPEINTGVHTVSGAGAPFDYNGDGYRDIVVISPARQWLIVPGSAAGLATPVSTGLPANGVIDFRGADMNGDGLGDLAYSELEGTSLVVRLRYAQRDGTLSAHPVTVYDQYLATGYDWYEGGDFLGARGQRIDLDGDGRDDLMMNENYSMARISADQSASDYFDGSFFGGTPADINGDGCTDFVYPHYTGRWRVRFSGCQVMWWPAPELIGPSVVGASATAFDFNGDGKDDILYRNATSTWQVALSNGGGLLPGASAGAAHGGASASIVSDINGDGLLDLVTVVSNGLRYRAHAGPKPDLLLAAGDGLGVTAAFEYAPLTGGLHTKLTGAAYPVVDLQDSRQVVSTLSVSDGSASGAMAIFRYRYEGLRAHISGRGDLGFARRTIIDGTLGYDLRTEEVMRQDFPFIGANAQRILRQASGLTVHERISQWSTLTYGDSPSQRFFPYLASATDRQYESGGAYNGTHHTTTAMTVASIDQGSGLVTDRTVTVTEMGTGLGTGSSRTERVLHSSVMNDTTNWCLGRPQSTQVTGSHTLPGGGSITRAVNQSWDGLQCRLVQQQLEPGSSQWQVTAAFGYDSFGNLGSRTVTGAGMEPRITTFGWGPRGQLPVSIVDALGHGSTLTWNYALGFPVSLTDPNALSTVWNHDGHGRTVLETRPDQTQTSWERTTCMGGCDARTRYVVHVREHDGSGVVQQTRTIDMDQFERPYRIGSQLLGGHSYVVTDFDARGRPRRHTLPQWLGGPGNGYREYTYDQLDRVTSEAWYGGSGAMDRSSTLSYGGRTTTLTDTRGGSHVQISSAWGDVLRTTDALGGSTGYQYDSFGRLTRVTDSLNHVVGSVTYNVRGMKTGQTDIDLGTWTLMPNALGEVVAQGNAKNQVTAFTYDKLSRPLTRVEPEGLTTWIWGASAAARNIGQLASVSGPGYSEAYAYDAWSRLNRRTIVSDATYEYAFAYNNQGLLDTLTYPVSTNGYRLKLGYEYAAGQPVRVRDSNVPATVLWELNAQDAAGNVVHETLGASIGVVTGFSPLTGLIEYRQAGVNGGSALQNLAYQWDAADNLVARQDLNRGLVESFEYDALDRLGRSRRNGVTNLELRYDAIGNITWKSDVGSYSYNTGRRHAVTAAGSGSYAYDANGNMIRRKGAPISWFSYNLPATLGAANGSQSQFSYAPDRSRWRQVASGAGTSETTVYIGGLMEKATASGITTYRHYILSPTGTAALYLRKSSGNPAEATYYLTHDHLGSTDKVLNAAGIGVAVAESFDAFGKRRGSNWTGGPGVAALAAISQTTHDGFTGHEHLEDLKLIHMSGRVYDPVIARFLSADPYVQAPFNGQGLNRYTYVSNNPLSLVDPSGFEGGSPADGGGRWLCSRGDCDEVLWWLNRGGTSYASQFVSAAERDPCGQDGSAMACHRPRGGVVAASLDAHAPGLSESLTSFGGLASQIGNQALDAIPGWYYSAQASAALTNRDYWLAFAFYGATIGDVFSGGSGAKATVVARGAVASIGGVVRRFEQQGTRTYYRVYSGDATRGKWLTSIPLRSSAQAQEALALPPWNSAAYIQEVVVPHGTLLERSRARPVMEWQRYRGGAEQFKLLETIPEANFGPGRPLP